MNVGLPGTGIGALFYVLLVLAMPLRELWVRWARPHRRRSWRFIGRQLAMVLGMLTVFGIEMRLIASALHRDRVTHASAAVGRIAHHARLGSFLEDQASRSAISSLVVLCAVLTAIHAVAWVGRLRERSRA